MDVKENSPNLVGQSRRSISVSACAASGSNLALLIAYNHLKKKLAKQKTEIYKLQNLKMASEPLAEYSTTQILERKVEQLQRSLQSKITAYNNLEETFKKTRENEEALIKHTTETEQMLDKIMEKTHVYQKENEEMVESMAKLSQRVAELENEKNMLEEELQDIKSFPEVSVLQHTSMTSLLNYHELSSPRNSDCDIPGSQNHLKQIEALLYENKTLKTNMYWLATELKTARNKKGLSPTRVRHDSGGLEEGRSGKKTKKEVGADKTCSCIRNIVAYTRKLQQAVVTLKTALEKNNVIINDLLVKQFGHVPKVPKESDSLSSCKLTESYVTINGKHMEENANDTSDHIILWEESNDEDFTLPELESASVIVPLEELISEDEPESELHTQLSTNLHQDISGVVDAVRYAGLYPDIRRGSLDYLQESGSDTHDIDTDHPDDYHDHDSLSQSYGDGILRKVNCACKLPLSLIHNLELQQTKTYLKSSKSSSDFRNLNYQETSKIFTPVGSPHNPERPSFLELLDADASNVCGNKKR